MATIPQAIDYGARPSLRTSRVDVPGQGELAVADAVERAASTFTQVMVERKEKQDRFNYSMAKQEFLTADLQRLGRQSPVIDGQLIKIAHESTIDILFIELADQEI